jgi:hypothetical protein
MSESNGQDVFRITRKGRKKFAFGEGQPFEVDVIAVGNQWYEISERFRDKDGKVPPDQTEAFNKAMILFVTELSGAASEGPETITLTEALEFLKLINEEGDRLRGFFTRESSAVSSSPASSELILEE